MKVAILFHRLGPYHVARLNAAARRVAAVAVELSSHSREYAWDPVATEVRFERLTLFTDGDSRDAPVRELAARVHRVLDQQKPAVVVTNGWSDRGALAALAWSFRTGTPAVVMSASQYHDEPRHPVKEWFKRHIVRTFRAGLAGGRMQAAYLEQLGVPRSHIFTGYDVVDNAHFAAGAIRARQDSQGLRIRLGLPERYFLATKRFVAKKNIAHLLDAYARYRGAADGRAWKLVLLGDGPLKPAILQQIQMLGLAGDVVLPGFKQYHELPTYYGLAGAFVHASTSEQWGLVVNEAMAAGLPVIISKPCGCAPELVEEGANGFTFDPVDAEALARHMAFVASNTCDRLTMGEAGRRIIANWTPDTFGRGLQQAAQAALEVPEPKVPLLDNLLLKSMLYR